MEDRCMSEIIIENLRYRYPHAKKLALDGLNFSVEKGEFIGIIGENGAGKSTAIKLILGLCRAEEGTVTVLGSDSKELSEKVKQDIGVSLAESGFSGELTVNDVKHILKKMYHSFDENYFIKQSENLKLPMNKKIKEFSTGMKAKLKVLVAISHHAKLLILDEPTAGLDVIARDELLELLREFMEKDEDRAILISSHISSDLETLCDDLYMIHDGKIILHEDTDVLLGDYALLKLDDTQYHALDKQYLLRSKKEPFGYSCLTDQKQYYIENYPDITIEKGTIDAVITMMIRGE